MNRLHVVLSVVLLIFFVFTNVLEAQPQERDPAKEDPILQELQKIAPKAVEVFKSATKDLDSDNNEDAIRQYNEVLKQAPNFEPALRRLGYALIATGKHSEGIAMTQKAVDLHRSADNLLGLSIAIVSPGNDRYIPSDSEITRALALAEEASKLSNGSDPDTLGMIAQLSLSLNKMENFNSAVSQLKTKFPDQLQTHYFNAIKLVNEGDFIGGTAEIKRAEELGLPHDEATQLLAGIEKFREESTFFGYGAYLKYVYLVGIIIVLWAVGLGLLFVIGKVLSARTLKSIENSDPNDITGGGHSTLKTAYRRLIKFASIYYYVSQPVLVALIILVTGGLIFGSFMIGTIPIGFLIGLVIVGAGTIFYMFKSLITRPKIEDPGLVLERSEAPQLWDLVERVAVDINTRPVDEIRITPGVELAVYERGGFKEKSQDKGQRVLILGAGSFNDFSTNGFRAVLAHEYGHLSNRDTAGGDIAFRVNAHMMRLAEAIVNSGNNTYHNLAFHFLRLYNFIFRRITHGASRLQEVLADRVAVNTYGAAAFTSGLTHVVRQEIVFQKLANSEISSALADSRKFNNIYDLKSESDTENAEIDDLFKAEFERQTTDDDTHPAAADRIRLAEKIAGQIHEDISGMVWDLFVDRQKFTAEMNILIEKQIRGERYSNYHDIGFSEVG